MGVCMCVFMWVWLCVYIWVLVGYVCKWFGVLDKEYRAFERSFLCTNFFELLIASDKLKAGPNDQDNALAKTSNGPQRTTNWLCIEHAQRTSAKSFRGFAQKYTRTNVYKTEEPESGHTSTRLPLNAIAVLSTHLFASFSQVTCFPFLLLRCCLCSQTLWAAV